jgi:simple sugar transport system permease protein
MGQFPYQLIAATFSLQTTGFDAIGVALLGRGSSIGVLLGALLFGGLRQGGTGMQLNANVPGDLVFIIQALVLFSIASEFLPAIQRSLPEGLKFPRRPPLVPATIGGTVVDLPDSVTVPSSTTSEDSSQRIEED